MQDYKRTTDELHKWAFNELANGNEKLASRIIKVVIRRQLEQKTWLEEQECNHGGESH